jgi:hypothetical protein
MGTTVYASLTHQIFVPLALPTHGKDDSFADTNDMKNRDDEFRRRSGHLRAMSNADPRSTLSRIRPAIVQNGLEPPEATISTRSPSSSLHQVAPFTVLSRVLPSMSDPMEGKTACDMLQCT